MYSIYKITCNKSKETYIGSTSQRVSGRISRHKSNPCCMSKNIINRDDWYYEVIYEDIMDKQTALLLEKTMINSDAMSINKKSPYQTREERLKQFRIKNKRNQETMWKCQREEYQRKKEYYTTKNICECGGKYTNKNIRTHEKSIKHIKFMEK